MGILAEFMAAAFNPSCAGGNHAAIYLEYCVTRWLMELVGFPLEGSMGLLVSGGSMASLTCLAAARHRAIKERGGDIRSEGLQTPLPLNSAQDGASSRLVLYLSSEGHSCLRKAVELLGLGSQSLRFIPVDNNYRMEVAALKAAIEADLAAGNQPFCVAASAGTVNTGAIDPLVSLSSRLLPFQFRFKLPGFEPVKQ
jgi:glutamate/tyrosine decarboxylase-like PLP-dependent enzyme